ncbi:tetratricopeptide repeat protein [Dactylosporangium cerinum]|uniref:Tetratricopeptide repeat protein n=1 Tax=Dactylosporangium cerinum TaxID=1434730 RepID=A0ABV9W585_9ACTN
MVAVLIEHGHHDEVRRLADAGDFACAQGLAGVQLAHGRWEAAAEALRPLADAGRWAAVDALAGILDAHDRTDEALTLVRRHATAGGPHTGPLLAELLARQGRTDEIVAMLLPCIADRSYAEPLVRLTTGHDDELARLLRDQLGTVCPLLRPAELLATVLERQEKVDEAVAVLRDHLVAVNDVAPLADILARHEREAQLRDLVAGAGGEVAALRLATWLEERGRVDDAVEVTRPYIAAPDAAVFLARLLTRHGRIGEAIDVLRPVPATMGEHAGCVVGELCDLLVERGRTDEALAFVDDLGARDGMGADLHLERAAVLVRAGRIESAIAWLRDRPDVRTWRVASCLADLLIDAGRPDDAGAVLDAVDRTDLWVDDLATLLIRRGKAAEALALFQEQGEDTAVKAELDAAFWSRFHAR